MRRLEIKLAAENLHHATFFVRGENGPVHSTEDVSPILHPRGMRVPPDEPKTAKGKLRTEIAA